MATTTLSKHLWWLMALLVLITPLTMNQVLNAITPAGEANPATESTRSGSSTDLPATLPMRFATQMTTTHQQLPNGWYLSQYQNELSRHSEGLVPYIPRMFDLDEFTSLQQADTTLGGEPYGRLLLRKKFSPRHYLAYFQYQLGDTRTESYTKAKLYQLPAALRGAQRFTLSIWQRPCSQPDCERESDQLETWLANQAR